VELTSKVALITRAAPLNLRGAGGFSPPRFIAEAVVDDLEQPALVTRGLPCPTSWRRVRYQFPPVEDLSPPRPKAERPRNNHI